LPRSPPDDREERKGEERDDVREAAARALYPDAEADAALGMEEREEEGITEYGLPEDELDLSNIEAGIDDDADADDDKEMSEEVDDERERDDDDDDDDDDALDDAMGARSRTAAIEASTMDCLLG
jgi:hypothetical protein